MQELYFITLRWLYPSSFFSQAFSEPHVPSQICPAYPNDNISTLRNGRWKQMGELWLQQAPMLIIQAKVQLALIGKRVLMKMCSSSMPVALTPPVEFSLSVLFTLVNTLVQFCLFVILEGCPTAFMCSATEEPCGSCSGSSDIATSPKPD